jgi:hypothetical protein
MVKNVLIGKNAVGKDRKYDAAARVHRITVYFA